MNNVLISIIVPAYNIESYIGRCLDSILMQQYKNIEVIVVNDGSADGTGKIIDQYALLDSRIIPIHKENGGVSSARLAGIKKASGEYIGFIDGDDYIEPQMYQCLYNNAIKYQADISHCGYKMVFPDGHEDLYYGRNTIIKQDKQQGIKDLLTGEFVEPSLVNKLYKRELFNNIEENYKFDYSIRINEDLLLNYFLFKSSTCAIYEDVCLYHYILRKNSAATSKINEYKLKDPLKVLKIIEEDINGDTNLTPFIVSRIAHQMIGISTMDNKKERELVIPYQKKVRRELRELVVRILGDKKYTKKLRVMSLWASFLPRSYSFIHNIYSKVKGYDKKYSLE